MSDDDVELVRLVAAAMCTARYLEHTDMDTAVEWTRGSYTRGSTRFNLVEAAAFIRMWRNPS